MNRNAKMPSTSSAVNLRCAHDLAYVAVIRDLPRATRKAVLAALNGALNNI